MVIQIYGPGDVYIQTKNGAGICKIYTFFHAKTIINVKTFYIIRFSRCLYEVANICNNIESSSRCGVEQAYADEWYMGENLQIGDIYVYDICDSALQFMEAWIMDAIILH